MYRIQWVKLWVDSLDASIRKIAPEERCVWYDLLLLSTVSGRLGYLERKEGMPFTSEEISSRLNVSMELYQRAIAKFLDEGRLVQMDGTLIIANWDRYQGSRKIKPSPDEARALREAMLYKLAREFPDIVNKLANPVKISPDGTIQNPEVLKRKEK